MLVHNVRYALHQFRRQPLLTLIVVLTLAVGIGLNATLFGIVNAVLLKPLPFRDADQLVTIEERNPGWSTALACDSAFVQWKSRSRSFAGIAASTLWEANLESGGQPKIVRSSYVTPQYFDVVGVHPSLGRTFTPAEAVRNGPRVVVLSNELWSELGGRPEQLNQSILLDGESFTVIGVMPPVEYQGPFLGWAEVWRPALIDEQEAFVRPNGWRGYRVIGRLQPGVSAVQASAEIALIEAQLSQELPQFYQGYTAAVRELHDYVAGDVRLILLLLLGAVLTVLLIACLNVSGLLLARTAAREKEIAIRLSQGATWRRLAGQLLTESCLLAFGAALLGLALAVGALRLFQAFGPANLPRLTEVQVNAQVVLFGITLCLGAGLITGLIPFVSLTRRSALTSLSAAGRGNTGPRSSHRLHNVLIIVEIAFAVPLLIGATLMLRSVSRLLDVDPGFQPHTLVVFDLSLPNARYRSDSQRLLFYRELLRRIRAIPRVKAAGANRYFPLKERQYSDSITVEGQVVPPGQERIVQYSGITDGYLQALGIPVREGRDFLPQEMWETGGAVLVNESLRRLLWPNEYPLGKRLRNGRTGPWLTVVGVVGDVRQRGLDTAAFPQIYTPYANYKHNIMTIAVRSETDPSAMIVPLAKVVREMDPALPPYQIMTGDQAVARTLQSRNIAMTILMALAAISVGLSAIGLYALLSFHVTERAKELGVRMALGAQSRTDAQSRLRPRAALSSSRCWTWVGPRFPRDTMDEKPPLQHFSARPCHVCSGFSGCPNLGLGCVLFAGSPRHRD